MRRTRGSPREGDRCTLRWWMKHARSRILRFRSTFLSLMRYQVRYPDAHVASLCLGSRLCALITLRPNGLWAIRKSQWRSLRDNPPKIVAQFYSTSTAERGRAVRPTPVKFRAARWLYRAGRSCSDLRAGRPLLSLRGAPRGTRPAMRVTQSVLPATTHGPRCTA